MKDGLGCYRRLLRSESLCATVSVPDRDNLLTDLGSGLVWSGLGLGLGFGHWDKPRNFHHL